MLKICKVPIVHFIQCFTAYMAQTDKAEWGTIFCLKLPVRINATSSDFSKRLIAVFLDLIDSSRSKLNQVL